VPDAIDKHRLMERRRIEDQLMTLGEEHERLEQLDALNRQAIRSHLQPAREVGITLRDIAELTGLSTQTLHTWMRELMRPIPAVHMGLGDPPPEGLEEAVLRTIAEEPDRSWTPSEVRLAIPAGWALGSTHEVKMALDLLSRSLQIWQTEDGYQITPPDETASDAAGVEGSR
jgi:hypothetical protein